jgi:hypothetical protein
VRLYCGIDGVPDGWKQVPDTAGALRLEKEKFGNAAQPYYAIVKPTGDGNFRILGTYGGLINSTDDFARFLRNGLKTNK